MSSFRSKPRRHIKPLKRNEYRCLMSVEPSTTRDFSHIEFEEEQYEWDKRWDKDDVITFSLVKDSKHIRNNPAEKFAVYYAMLTWSKEIPLNIIQAKEGEVPSISIEFVDPKDDDVFRYNKDVLAYAHMPGTKNQGIIRFNDSKSWMLNTSPFSLTKKYNMVHTLIHEIGHSLGLSHASGSFAKNSIMFPKYNGKLQLSEYDQYRIIKKYGNKQYDSYKTYQETTDLIKNCINMLKDT